MDGRLLEHLVDLSDASVARNVMAAAQSLFVVAAAAFATLASCAAQGIPRLPRLECPAPSTFDQGKAPLSERHVAVDGDDQTGDGSPQRPYRTIARAATDLTPGTAIRIHPGAYSGQVHLSGVGGTADAPIWMTGLPGEVRPLLDGGQQGIYLSRVQYLVLEHLEIANTNDNGINADDGEERDNATATHHLVFRHIAIHDTGRQPNGVADCLKLAGANDVVVADSTFARCGRGPDSGAVGIGGVGTHRVTIAGNMFDETGFGGVQVKGGAGDVRVIGNRFNNVGPRGINMGGSTSPASFRPPLKTTDLNYEASRVEVIGNVFVGGETAAAFVGCVACQFVRNTVVYPSRWLLRILQETRSQPPVVFFPASQGVIAGNAFFFRRSDLALGEDINIGDATDPASFTLQDNQWFAVDAEHRSAAVLPTFTGRRAGNIEGVAPDFASVATNDFRVGVAEDAVFPPGAPTSCLIPD